MLVSRMLLGKPKSLGDCGDASTGFRGRERRRVFGPSVDGACGGFGLGLLGLGVWGVDLWGRGLPLV